MDIRITGASQNTLRHINLELPAGKLIALMGPSGSGKTTAMRNLPPENTYYIDDVVVTAL